ncbi:ABC transporter substrate-binding protein [Nocardia yamanashiensis]|uniref:ABC transporter substrate-binding protein n=1 Tax=Nocardia yamanashiensis TaxID=209247 RepID=UPI001E606FD0|nr:ABC transporter substrate-binding protein [Nocardia yamanashiensis]UGT43129.1 ABC transporter substrate-binding protein [Nocardia yamanashiensis]
MRSTIHKLGFAVAAALLAGGCATSGGGDTDLSAALPTAVPPGTELSISVNTTRVALEASGQSNSLPFTVSEWPVVQAGPDVIQAFRGGALDVASNAGIPPIHAHATGVDAKIVGVKVRSTPLYQLATAPGSSITGLNDLRGKRIGFSPGQAQGVVILRTLQAAGIRLDEVQLVELNSPQFLTALQGKQIDVAPLAEPQTTKYLAQYGAQGARAVPTPAVDALTILWAPTAVLRDSAKLAAVTEFVKVWARADIWAWEHQDQWLDAYYVKDQKVSAEDGRRILAATEKPYYPVKWDDAIKWEQETIDLVTGSGYFGKKFDAAELFDKRFEAIAAAAVPEKYRTKEAQ